MTRLALVAVLLLVACSAERPPASRAVAPPAPAPTATAVSSADPSGLLVAVVRRSGGLELHRIDRSTRTASLERVLEPPAPGAAALDVTLSPALVCASWHVGVGQLDEDPRSSLICYPAGSSAGRTLRGTRRPVEVALSDDGQRIAWADLDRGENQVLNVARLHDGSLSEHRRVLARTDRPETGPQAFIGTAVQDLAWVDDHVLAISTVAESDDGPDLLRFDAADGARGWLDAGVAVEVQDEAYFAYDSVVSVDGSTALAVQRGSYLDEAAPSSRAVRVDLATGEVLEVLALAAAGRSVVAVSGGRDGVVYVTADADRALTPYLRLPGEQRGEVVTGLPADATQVLAEG